MKPGLLAQAPPFNPMIAAFETFPLPNRLLSTYAVVYGEPEVTSQSQSAASRLVLVTFSYFAKTWSETVGSRLGDRGGVEKLSWTW